jgi:hypothetical protein
VLGLLNYIGIIRKKAIEIGNEHDRNKLIEDEMEKKLNEMKDNEN